MAAMLAAAHRKPAGTCLPVDDVEHRRFLLWEAHGLLGDLEWMHSQARQERFYVHQQVKQLRISYDDNDDKVAVLY